MNASGAHSQHLTQVLLPQAPNYIAMVYDVLDEYLLGGTQWGWTDNWTPSRHDGWNQENFSITDQRRQIRSNYAIRAYPRAIAGIPGQFRVNCLAPLTQSRVRLNRSPVS